MMPSMRKALSESINNFDGMKVDALHERRHERLMSYGKFKEITEKS
jgi:acetyl-CoA carboxylase carboxyl transferase subunit alpha